MRDHIGNLADEGLFRRVSKPVDKDWEIGCMARWIYQGLSEEERFGICFDNVDGYATPVMTAVLGASREVYARALSVDTDEIHDHWRKALNNPKDPVLVDDAPVQQHVKRGEEASLDDLPIPVWTPRKDAGPYVTALVVTKNRETGNQNMATYRCYVRDGQTIAINLTPGRHGHMHYQTFAEQGEPAPIAIAIAAEPAAHFSGIANVSYDTDEAEVAGGLLEEPLKRVQAETIDLEVPANAEFIIEGEVDPEARINEGPFGEFAGYMGEVFEKPVFDVSAITHRSDPIYYGYISQMPPSESTTIQSISNAAMYHKQLAEDMSHPAVSDLYIDRTYGGLLAHAIVAMDPQYPSHAKEVGRLLADTSALKRITVVNDDVDIRDPMHIDWVMNSRFNPQRDVTVIEDVYLPAVLDPSVQEDEKGRPMTSKLVVDATVELDMEDGRPVVNKPDLSIPPKDLMQRALDSWADTDLPDLEPKERMRRMIDKHPGSSDDA